MSTFAIFTSDTSAFPFGAGANDNRSDTWAAAGTNSPSVTAKLGAPSSITQTTESVTTSVVEKIHIGTWVTDKSPEAIDLKAGVTFALHNLHVWESTSQLNAYAYIKVSIVTESGSVLTYDRTVMNWTLVDMELGAVSGSSGPMGYSTFNPFTNYGTIIGADTLAVNEMFAVEVGIDVTAAKAGTVNFEYGDIPNDHDTLVETGSGSGPYGSGIVLPMNFADDAYQTAFGGHNEVWCPWVTGTDTIAWADIGSDWTTAKWVTTGATRHVSRALGQVTAQFWCFQDDDYIYFALNNIIDGCIQASDHHEVFLCPTADWKNELTTDAHDWLFRRDITAGSSDITHLNYTAPVYSTAAGDKLDAEQLIFQGDASATYVHEWETPSYSTDTYTFSSNSKTFQDGVDFRMGGPGATTAAPNPGGSPSGAYSEYKILKSALNGWNGVDPMGFMANFQCDVQGNGNTYFPPSLGNQIDKPAWHYCGEYYQVGDDKTAASKTTVDAADLRVLQGMHISGPAQTTTYEPTSTTTVTTSTSNAFVPQTYAPFADHVQVGTASNVIDFNPPGFAWGNQNHSFGAVNDSGWGQSFTGNGKTIDSISLWLGRADDGGTGTFDLEIYAHTGTYGTGTPTGAALATVNINYVDIPATSGNNPTEFAFTGFQTVAGTNYCVTCTDLDLTSDVTLRSLFDPDWATADTDSGWPTHPGGLLRKFTTSWAWYTPGNDAVFSINTNEKLNIKYEVQSTVTVATRTTPGNPFEPNDALNPGFDTDTEWLDSSAGDWTIANGVAHHAPGASNSYLYQAAVCKTSTLYDVTLTISNYVVGNVAAAVNSQVFFPTISADGTYTKRAISGTNTAWSAGIYGYNTFEGDIDNVSFTEVNFNLSGQLFENSQLNTDTIWGTGTGWTIANGVAHKAPGVASPLSQAQGIVIDEFYEVTFTISNYVAGAAQPVAGQTLGAAYSADGTYTQQIKASSTSWSGVQANDTFEGDIDNVEIRHLMPHDIATLSIAYLIEPTSTVTVATRTTFDQEFNPNDLLNPDFESGDTLWIKNGTWTISGGKAHRTAATSGYLYQSNVSTAETLYEVTFTISNYVAGNLRPVARSAVGGNAASNGTHTFRLESGTGALSGVYADPDFEGSVDDIHISEYKPTLSANLFLNSGFDSDTVWTNTGGDWTIAGGVAHHAPGAGSTYMDQVGNPGSIATEWYECTFEITNYVAGAVNASAGDRQGNPGFSSDGIHTKVIQALSNDGDGGLGAAADFEADIEFFEMRHMEASSVTTLSKKMEVVSTVTVETNTNFEIFGAQELANPGFDTDTGWDKGAGWTIANGVAHHVAQESAGAFLIQAGLSKIDTIYEVEFTVSNYVSGSVYGVVKGQLFTPKASSNGSFKIRTISGRSYNGDYSGVYATEFFTGDIDNISIREVVTYLGPEQFLNADFTGGDVDWFHQGNWSIAGLQADHTPNPGVNDLLYQTNIATPNRYHTMLVLVGGYVDGAIRLGINGSPAGDWFTGDGAHSRFGISTGTYHSIQADPDFEGAITYATVKQWESDFADLTIQTIHYPTALTEVKTQSFSETLSDNKVLLNPGFDADTNWLKQGTWIISGGKANRTAASSGWLYQNGICNDLQLHEVSFTITNYVSGILYGAVNGVIGPGVTGNGNHVIRVFSGTSGTCGAWAGSSFEGSVDNISIREVSTTRSAQQIVNPGFDTDTIWGKGTGWTIAGNVAHHEGGVAGSLTQTHGKIDVFYETKFDVLNWVVGTCRPVAGQRTGGADVSGNQTAKTEVIRAVLSTWSGITVSADYEADVDNFEILEVISANPTLITFEALPISASSTVTVTTSTVDTDLNVIREVSSTETVTTSTSDTVLKSSEIFSPTSTANVTTSTGDTALNRQSDVSVTANVTTSTGDTALNIKHEESATATVTTSTNDSKLTRDMEAAVIVGTTSVTDDATLNIKYEESATANVTTSTADTTLARQSDVSSTETVTTSTGDTALNIKHEESATANVTTSTGDTALNRQRDVSSTETVTTSTDDATLIAVELISPTATANVTTSTADTTLARQSDVSSTETVTTSTGDTALTRKSSVSSTETVTTTTSDVALNRETEVSSTETVTTSTTDTALNRYSEVSSTETVTTSTTDSKLTRDMEAAVIVGTASVTDDATLNIKYEESATANVTTSADDTTLNRYIEVSSTETVTTSTGNALIVLLTGFYPASTASVTTSTTDTALNRYSEVSSTETVTTSTSDTTLARQRDVSSTEVVSTSTTDTELNRQSDVSVTASVTTSTTDTALNRQSDVSVTASVTTSTGDTVLELVEGFYPESTASVTTNTATVTLDIGTEYNSTSTASVTTSTTDTTLNKKSEVSSTIGVTTSASNVFFSIAGLFTPISNVTTSTNTATVALNRESEVSVTANVTTSTSDTTLARQRDVSVTETVTTSTGDTTLARQSDVSSTETVATSTFDAELNRQSDVSSTETVTTSTTDTELNRQSDVSVTETVTTSTADTTLDTVHEFNSTSTSSVTTSTATVTLDIATEYNSTSTSTVSTSTSDVALNKKLEISTAPSVITSASNSFFSIAGLFTPISNVNVTTSNATVTLDIATEYNSTSTETVATSTTDTTLDIGTEYNSTSTSSVTTSTGDTALNRQSDVSVTETVATSNATVTLDIATEYNSTSTASVTTSTATVTLDIATDYIPQSTANVTTSTSNGFFDLAGTFRPQSIANVTTSVSDTTLARQSNVSVTETVATSTENVTLDIASEYNPQSTETVATSTNDVIFSVSGAFNPQSTETVATSTSDTTLARQSDVSVTETVATSTSDTVLEVAGIVEVTSIANVTTSTNDTALNRKSEVSSTETVTIVTGDTALNRQSDVSSTETVTTSTSDTALFTTLKVGASSSPTVITSTSDTTLARQSDVSSTETVATSTTDNALDIITEYNPVNVSSVSTTSTDVVLQRLFKISVIDSVTTSTSDVALNNSEAFSPAATETVTTSTNDVLADITTKVIASTVISIITSTGDVKLVKILSASALASLLTTTSDSGLNRLSQVATTINVISSTTILGQDQDLNKKQIMSKFSGPNGDLQVLGQFIKTVA